MITWHDVLKFIIKYRKDKVFKNLDELGIYNVVKNAINSGLMLVDVDDKCQRVLGVVIAEAAPAYKLLHVKYILTIDPDSIKRFVKQFRERFPGWGLQAYRHDNLVRYKNTDKLCERILKYGRGSSITTV